MAIYYSRISTISRSKGHSAVAAAAYRAGVCLTDTRTDKAHDFTKRRGVQSSRMLAPKNSPWALDVKTVWSKAEHAEVRRNARTGRELVVALPAELSDAENDVLAQRLGQDLVDAYGVAVLVAVHAPDAHGDERNRHVHLLMTTRSVEANGFGAKVRVLDDQTSGPLEAQAMRERIAALVNDALGRAGHTARVDPRRLVEQASDAADRGDFDGVVALTRTPMRHQGQAATATAREGHASPVVAANGRRKSENAIAHRWGTERAGQLRHAAQVRGERSARAPRTTRSQELRKGLGALAPSSRATGVDAELLNAQARASEESLAAQRTSVEAYLDALAGVADQQAIALRAQAMRTGQTIDADSSLLAAQRAAAARAKKAFDAVADDAARHRRAAALAQHETALARAVEASLDEEKPDAWRVMSRRKWAEHRRRQRAETQRKETAEHEASLITTISAGKLEVAAHALRAAERQLEKTAENTGKSGQTPGFGEALANEESQNQKRNEEEGLISGMKSQRRRRKWR